MGPALQIFLPLSYIHSAVDRKVPVDVLYIPRLSESASHSALSCRNYWSWSYRTTLHGHGFNVTWLQWYHCVYVNGVNSSTLSVLSEVPHQGSIWNRYCLFMLMIYQSQLTEQHAICLRMTPNSWNQFLHPYCFTSRWYYCCWGLLTWCHKWNLSLNLSKCCTVRFSLGKCDSGTYIYSG